MWGNSLPYLVSVDSPEGDEVPNYHTTVTLTADQVRELVLAAYPNPTCPETHPDIFRPDTHRISRGESGA